MKTLKITRKVTAEAIKEMMKAANNASDFKRWQIIYLVLNYQVDADYLADTTGYSKSNIYSIVQQFNHHREDIGVKPKGGRRRLLLSIEEEKKLLKGLEDHAMKGQLLTYRDIKVTTEKAVGRAVSDDYIWDLFKRNGWTKHSPRPHHPKKDASQQEAFKINSRTVWLPLKMILANP